MDVEVRCYGDVREVVGERSVELELAPCATVANLLEAIASATAYDPFDLPKGRHLAVMRDRRHLDADSALEDGDAVAISESPMPE